MTEAQRVALWRANLPPERKAAMKERHRRRMAEVRAQARESTPEVAAAIQAVQAMPRTLRYGAQMQQKIF